ncbi:hypothetical protein L3Q82_006118 [Scortum barcoo]|uniref:Uncharacterized protein n=1 Tax=Scortum barcoo TaxID=214431 RepID=A0ACB8X2U5_9TELE|nr:hypothetical protein L3Q82_006118 [Scortum barcoo]
MCSPDGSSLTAIRYRDEILRPLVRPYAGAVGPGFLLMQDNARPHVAGVCQQFLQDEGIDAMDWPARSPDLNPIEHIWDIMSRSIHQRHVAPQTVQELADALVQDNDPKHSSRLCKGYLTKKESDGVLRQMTWPPQSPDLNPIEMVWDSKLDYNHPSTVRSRVNTSSVMNRSLLLVLVCLQVFLLISTFTSTDAAPLAANDQQQFLDLVKKLNNSQTGARCIGRSGGCSLFGRVKPKNKVLFAVDPQ